jgi:hypothetical protein
LLCGANGACTCNEAPWRVFLIRDPNQYLRKFGGISGLLAAVTFPKFHLLRSALVIILIGQLCEICRFFGEKLSAEETKRTIRGALLPSK